MSDLAKLGEMRVAVRQGDIDKVLAFVSEDRSRLDAMTAWGTWLHIASRAGHLELVRQLVALGMDVDRRGGTFGGSAINLAARYGHIEIVEFLLERGAELDLSEPERNPLFAAIQGGHIGIVKILIDRGIDTSVAYTGPSMRGMTAVAFARELGKTAIVALLADS